MSDVQETERAVTRRVRHAKRSAGRLLVSGIGFSAAYFLDPDHGAARRKQAVDVLRRAKRSRQEAKTSRSSQADARDGDRGLRQMPDSRVVPQFGSNGVSVGAQW
jgi:hypothetical protein